MQTRRSSISLSRSSLILAALLVPAISHAITIDAALAPGEVLVGETAALELRISGLGAATAPSLGSFRLEVAYDETHLALDGFDFGDPLLGDQLSILGVPPVQGVTSTPAGVSILEVSLDPASILDAFQAPAFVIGTLRLTGLAEGSTEVAISVAELGDALGEPLPAGPIAPARIHIGSAIPEPGSALLFALGLSVVHGARRRWPRDSAALPSSPVRRAGHPAPESPRARPCPTT